MSGVMIFFCSWGGAYTPCDASHPDAIAFGPTGIARAIDVRDFGVDRQPDETSHRAAERLGVLRCAEDCDGWDWMEGDAR